MQLSRWLETRAGRRPDLFWPVRPERRLRALVQRQPEPRCVEWPQAHVVRPHLRKKRSRTADRQLPGTVATPQSSRRFVALIPPLKGWNGGGWLERRPQWRCTDARQGAQDLFL